MSLSPSLLLWISHSWWRFSQQLRCKSMRVSNSTGMNLWMRGGEERPEFLWTKGGRSRSLEATKLAVFRIDCLVVPLHFTHWVKVVASHYRIEQSILGPLTPAFVCRSIDSQMPTHWVIWNDWYGAISCRIFTTKLSPSSWLKALCNDVFGFKLRQNFTSNKAYKNDLLDAQSCRLIKSDADALAKLERLVRSSFLLDFYKKAITVLVIKRTLHECIWF